MPGRRQPKDPKLSTRAVGGRESVVLGPGRQLRRRAGITACPSPSPDEKLAQPLPQLAREFDEERFFEELLGREATDGKYAIRNELTTGGMGAIYYVYDRDFQRYSAMKVILPERKQDATSLATFLREARLTGQLEHPNIVPVHDLGYIPEHGAYFTMKLIQGQPLSEILRGLECDNPECVDKYNSYALLNIFRKVCDAVAFAHSRHVLHRDIKPQNIMVGDYGEVLLMDWGLARVLAPEGSSDESPATPRSGNLPENSTETAELGLVKGSPAYMSPEQAKGEIAKLNPTSDIFLLGATLYDMFTFYPPYLGDDVYAVVQKARCGRIVPPTEMGTSRWDIPEELSRIMMKAMARRQADRYQSVAELSADLDALLRGDMQYRRRSFAAGEPLMREGEPGSECYILDSGTVSVYRDREGEQDYVCSIQEGNIVGEMALITHRPRSATVIADEDVEVLVLSQEDFTRNLEKLPMWMSRTISALAQRLSERGRGS